MGVAPRSSDSESEPAPESEPALAATLIASLIERGLTIAVAESLTGGRLVAALVDIPGASATVLGGVVAYNTELKHSVLGVSAHLLAANGPVDPDVARQMASGVCTALAVDGRPADIGVATTGVAGPDPQGGAAVGTVHIGIAIAGRVRSEKFLFSGTRDDIRNQSVDAAIALVLAEVTE